MSIDAMRQALEALEECIGYKTSPFMTRECEAAITALRAAIEQAQPEQNRAKKMRDAGYTRRPTLREFPREDAHPDKAPRQWQGLTEKEICPWFQENTALTNKAAMRITRAIEAKLREKNI